MKAFVFFVRPDGRDGLGTGTHGGRVSPAYKTWRGLRSWVKRSPKGVYHVQVYRSWDRRYGKPDIDTYIEVE